MRPVLSLGMRTIATCFAALTLAACTHAGQAPAVGDPAPPPPAAAAVTVIRDQAAADRLLGAKGITLQWIDWNRRGSVNARMVDGRILLTGSQRAATGPGRLFIDGWVSEVGPDYFTFEGTIRITDAPDGGRRCEANKSWRFAITQNRPYWRLREFEWCDGLTDYVDIYF